MSIVPHLGSQMPIDPEANHSEMTVRLAVAAQIMGHGWGRGELSECASLALRAPDELLSAYNEVKPPAA